MLLKKVILLGHYRADLSVGYTGMLFYNISKTREGRSFALVGVHGVIRSRNPDMVGEGMNSEALALQAQCLAELNAVPG